MQSRQLWRLMWAILILAVGVGPVAAQSKNRYKVEDDVIVKFLGDWIPAKVLQTNRQGEVMAEYQFAGGTQKRVFKPVDVRFPHEKDALYQTRLWSSASGEFRVAAALVGLDKTSATLRKADMTEIKVPMASLSASDQQLLERVRREMGERSPQGNAPQGPEETVFSTTLPPLSFNASGDQANPVPPDPAPAYLTLKQGGFGFPKSSIHDQLGTVLPLGGAGSLLLATVEGFGDTPTRVLWINLEKQKIEGQQILPSGEIVVDYHPPTHRLLTFKNDRSLSGVMLLTVWEVLPTEKEVTPVIRWKAPAKWVHEPWARIVDGNIVLHRVDQQEFVGWDLTAKQARFRINQESFFQPLPVQSPGRRELFVCEDKQVRVYNALTGDLMSTLPAPNGSSAVAVTRDGRRAAVLNRNMLAVWDLTNPGSGPEEFQAEAIGTPFSAKLYWVDNDRLMADNGPRGNILFGLKERMALWKYNFDHDAVREDRGRRLRAIVDGHLVYAASFRSGTQMGLAVGAVKLPGPQVDEAAAALDRSALLVMKPGSPVRLDVQVDPQYQSQVMAALQKKVADNQWMINPSAPAVLAARMARGKTQTTTYRNMLTRSEQSVTVTPFVSSLVLKVGENVAWQSGTSTGLPSMMRLKEGQSAQGEVDKYQRPNPGFFEQVEIPSQISDPTKREGLGVTNVTTRGLEPQAAP